MVSKEKFIKTICEILQRKRKETGKTIYQISAESFMLNSTWRKVEGGKYGDIKISTLWKMLEGLEFPPEDFIKELKEALGKDFTLIDE